MNRFQKVSIAAAVALALGALGWNAVNDSSPSSTAAKIDWPAGKELTYALEWSTRSETLAATAVAQGEVADRERGASAIKSSVDVTGELVLSSYGKREDGDGYHLRARFEHLTRVSLTAFEKQMLPNLDVARGELEGHTADLTIRPNGEVADVKFQAKDPALFRYLMQAALNELSVSVGEKVSVLDSDGPSGRGPATFTREGNDFTRTREHYDSLSAWPDDTALEQKVANKATIKVAGGVVEGIADEETLEANRKGGSSKDIVSRTAFSLQKKAERTFAASEPPPLENLITANEAMATESDKARADRLGRRTQGVTVDTILDEVRIHAAVPKGKNNQWAWVATGYLELHPEKTLELVDKMRGLDHDGKGYALDLLVMTGHEQAQAAIVQAFSDPTVVEQTHEYAYLVQRIGRLRTPTKGTASYFADRYAAAKEAQNTPVRRSTAIALGAIIYHLAEHDRELARKLDDALVMDLFAAKTAEDRQVLVMALGNASLEEDATAIRLQAHDDSPEVRASVASALRRIDSADVRQTLIELSGDESASVSREAVLSLDRHALEQDDLLAIGEEITAGRVNDSNAHSVVSMLANHRATAPREVAGALDALVMREGISSEARARAIQVRETL